MNNDISEEKQIIVGKKRDTAVETSGEEHGGRERNNHSRGIVAVRPSEFCLVLVGELLVVYAFFL